MINFIKNLLVAKSAEAATVSEPPKSIDPLPEPTPPERDMTSFPVLRQFYEKNKEHCELLIKECALYKLNPEHLARIIRAESAFKEKVKAKTSTASGYFQFIKSTWAAMYKKYGQYIPKNDPFHGPSNIIAGVLFTKDNVEYLKNVLGHRDVTVRMMYLAHFSGVAKAAKVIQLLAKSSKATIYDAYSSKEIAANRSLFQSESLATFYMRLTDKVAK